MLGLKKEFYAGIEKRILLKGNLNPNQNSHSSKIFKNLYEFAKYLDLKSNSQKIN